ncbi:MAG: metallophosphoesterase family protein [Methyloligellaceae bacterium]
MPKNLTPQLEGADRLLVFGGPYSNLQATQAMRAEAVRLGIGPEHTICTGDVVAYCANPVETVAQIRNWGVHVVAGNCEQQLAADADDCACGFEEGSACDVLAKGWYAYADRQVEHDDRVWMGGLPDEARFTWAGTRFRVVHGACGETSRFAFPSEHGVIAEQLAACDADVVIAGHSGIPFGHTIDGQFWFNAGVIGQPANDGTQDGWYGLLGRSNASITFQMRRLHYDFATARAAVLAAGYADPYGETLGSGIWPNDHILPDKEKDAAGTAIEPITFVFPTAARAEECAA